MKFYNLGDKTFETDFNIIYYSSFIALLISFQSISQLILFRDGTLSNTASAFALPRGRLETFRIKF